jgi:hypothetical protein
MEDFYLRREIEHFIGASLVNIPLTGLLTWDT